MTHDHRLHPRIAGLSTSLPPYALPQTDVVAHAAETFGRRFRDFERLRPVFENTGIDTRYSVRPIEWFHEAQDWKTRTGAFLEGATDLFVAAAAGALARSGFRADEIDTVVTVCSTGIATPSLEARASARLGLRADVRRVPVFGLGCAGGVTGLALASRLADSVPGSRVLLVAVEICTLAFRADELTKSNIVATALFGDGAAAAVLTADAGEGPRIVASGEHMWPDTLGIMGWSVDPLGFGAIFSSSIPDLVDEKMYAAVAAFLKTRGEVPQDLDGFAFHPGGRKVIEALERSFALGDGALSAERDILRDHGNMSAPTALFVLKRKLAGDLQGKCILSALGPGFTGSFVRLDA
ncbi:type III polyketide synthase [Fulvimarina sp. 2208YS6-2-32]|uniref:Type III polyketide synthase n=1 Tax=Fulvimarina uroteuthidis TaxID=3098149 RepID=A0ABU5I342_9HYPH|nr:type III polyketide synthase [Fulvimarina sp. 2208YS6-2-32]MDY8109786.1 type III polyketide synthase [Fulvimarina sp. 2208YS6-2-32]